MKREKNDKEVFFLKTEIGPEQCLMYRDVREHGLIGALGAADSSTSRSATRRSCCAMHRISMARPRASALRIETSDRAIQSIAQVPNLSLPLFSGNMEFPTVLGPNRRFDENNAARGRFDEPSGCRGSGSRPRPRYVRSSACSMPGATTSTPTASSAARIRFANTSACGPSPCRQTVCALSITHSPPIART